MSLVAALIFAAAAPAAAEAEEITVIAQRLRSLSVAVSRDAQGRYQCDLAQSTGLLKLDAELCKATTKCVRKGKAGQDEVRACIEKAKPSLMARIRDYLRAERAGAGA